MSDRPAARTPHVHVENFTRRIVTQIALSGMKLARSEHDRCIAFAGRHPVRPAWHVACPMNICRVRAANI